MRRLVTKEIKSRYERGSRGERSAILNELCALTGWHRGHARKALRTAEAPGEERPPRKVRDPVWTYGEDVLEPLRICWARWRGQREAARAGIPTGGGVTPARGAGHQ